MSPDMQKEDIFYVPRLEADGSNWSIYCTRLVWAMDARGIMGHLVSVVRAGRIAGGSTTTVIAGLIVTVPTGYLAGIVPADPNDPKYHQNEAIAKQTLGCIVPDSIL